MDQGPAGDPSATDRRTWRRIHNPVVKRGDPIFNLAEGTLPIASIAMLVSSLGVSKRGPASPEVSAVFMVASASVIGVVLLAVAVRLAIKPAAAPFSAPGAITLICISALSPVILWARNEGVLTPFVVAAAVANILCLLIGVLALVMARLRTPR